MEDRGVLRVERGSADEAELAAVAVVLFSLLTALRERRGADRPERHGAARWRRWERSAAYRPPHSWQ
ncbi:acyl-CoA carboxylase subunit epsilon [Streptomyces phaeochromogenes]